MNVFDRARRLSHTKEPEVIKTTCAVCSVSVVFDLPDWTLDERFDNWITKTHGLGHIWEGSYKGCENRNILSEGLFDLKIPGIQCKVTTVCLNMQTWTEVCFSCGTGDLLKQIKLFQTELGKFLNQIQKEC